MADFQGGTGDGGGGGSTVNLVANEVPGGAIDGLNTSFTLAFLYVAGTLQVFKNGQLLEPGAANDYLENGLFSGFTTTIAPEPLDKLLVSYVKQ